MFVLISSSNCLITLHIILFCLNACDLGPTLLASWVNGSFGSFLPLPCAMPRWPLVLKQNLACVAVTTVSQCKGQLDRIWHQGCHGKCGASGSYAMPFSQREARAGPFMTRRTRGIVLVMCLSSAASYLCPLSKWTCQFPSMGSLSLNPIWISSCKTYSLVLQEEIS